MAKLSSSSYSLMLFAVKGIGAFLLGTLLLIYVPITAIGLGAILLLTAGCIFLDHKNLLVLVCALGIVTLALELAVRWLAPAAMNPHYRPHEKLALEKIYRSNQTIHMQVPHGDLPATDPMLPVELAQPRQESFTTDSLGYRNNTDYEGEPLLIVGDSLVVGIGNTQEDTLTSQLRRDYGIRAYNLGFSGDDPQGYAGRIKWARTKFPADSCIAAVFFEGNDFQLVQSAEVAAREAVPKGFQELVKSYVQFVRGRSEFARTFYGLTTRSWEIIRERLNANASELNGEGLQGVTFVKNIGGKPMGFLRGYMEVVRRQSYDDHGFIKKQMREAAPDFVLFVPDKYRVYAGLFDDGAVDSLPNAQWDHLLRTATQLGIPAFNLTPQLVEHSKKVLPQQKTTYWRDDTHWNKEGIAVGARRLAEVLSSFQSEPCMAVHRKAASGTS